MTTTTDYSPVRYVKATFDDGSKNGKTVFIEVTTDKPNLFGGIEVNREGETIWTETEETISKNLILGFPKDWRKVREYRVSKRYGVLVPLTTNERHLK